MRYHITIVKSSEKITSLGFFDAGLPLMYSLRDLGHEATIGVNTVHGGECVNVMLCYQSMKVPIPERYVIWQLESVLDANGKLNEREDWIDAEVWERAEEVWDYSQDHLAQWESMGHVARWLPLGHHPTIGMDDGRQIVETQQDIDVLFYGPINPRRKRILRELRGAGLRVQNLSDIFGIVRDEWIKRSKVVLSIHWYDHCAFEQMRVGPLLARGACVASEGKHDAWGMPGIPYDDLMGTVIEMVNSPNERAAFAKYTAERFRDCPMVDYVREVVQ